MVDLKKLQCFKCGVELERQGVSSFGKCPECSRKMLFSEWRKLGELLGYSKLDVDETNGDKE